MRILTVGPTGVVAMQRVLTWMAEHQEDVWVVHEDDRFRPLLPAGFHFSTFSLPRGAAPRAADVTASSAWAAY